MRIVSRQTSSSMPFNLCFCGKAEKETYRVLDYSHGNLINVPTDIYDHAPTLEELYLDANQIKDLPKVFYTLPVYIWLLWHSVRKVQKLTEKEENIGKLPYYN